MSKTIAILHGFAGGWWHTREFNKALNKADLRQTKKPGAADIIFAHSGGCYRIPENNQAKLIVLVGPPYWPNKSILRRMLLKKNQDTSLRFKERGLVFAVNKFIWELVYIIIKPSYMFIALKHHRYLHFLDLLENKKVILIRNDEDYFCSPQIKDAVKKYTNIKYMPMPGNHDDFMTNPQPYIDLMLKEL
jgi:hypothetical protein